MAPMAGKIVLRIQEAVEEAGLSPTDLMRQAGVAYGTALKLAKGQHGDSISLAMLARLCDVLGKTPGELIEYVPAALVATRVATPARRKRAG